MRTASAPYSSNRFHTDRGFAFCLRALRFYVSPEGKRPLPQQCGASSRHAEVDPKTAVHRPGLNQGSPFSHREIVSTATPSARPEPFGSGPSPRDFSESDCPKEGQVAHERLSNLLVSIVVEDEFAAWPHRGTRSREPNGEGRPSRPICEECRTAAVPTSFFPHSGHRHGNGFLWECGISVVSVLSGVMDAHHVNCGIVRVALNEDRFDVQEPAANFHAKVVMEPVFANATNGWTRR